MLRNSELLGRLRLMEMHNKIMAALKPGSDESSDEEQVIEYPLQKCLSCYYQRRGVQLMMTGCHVTSSRMFNEELFDYLYKKRYLCIENDHGIDKWRISNEQILGKFVEVLSGYYQKKFDMNENNIKDCTNSFLELFSYMDKNEQDLVMPLQNIERKIKDLASERIFSLEGNCGEYDLWDIIFVPLFQTGFQCTVWVCLGAHMSLYHKKCAVLLQLSFSLTDSSQTDFKKIVDNKRLFPDGVDQYVVVVLYFNIDNKSVTIHASHKRNLSLV